jgi:GNAT superfamily N-acetyltransferase
MMGQIDRLLGLTAPALLSDAHDLTAFSSGVAALDDWLKRRALRNGEDGASRTFAICHDGCVVGYYSLSAGAIYHAEATGKVRRNMPDPIPVALLGRLAVDQGWQGQGLGRALLCDAILRTLVAAETIGVRALLVHALSEEAKTFYERSGFRPSPVSSMTLMITLLEAREAVGKV